MLVVLALRPSEKEGFTHLVGQLRTSHCTKQRNGGLGVEGGVMGVHTDWAESESGRTRDRNENID